VISLNGCLNVEELSSLPDEEFIAALTAISGIGPWTAQGALLIALQREDVVLPGDQALRKTVQSDTSSTTCRANKRSSPSPTHGGPTAAWPPVTYSPRPSM